MEIESKDVASGGTFENPIFTERTIKGTARVQNNKTLLLASVAQDVEGNGRAGLPVLGWLPIIGRLFSTPTRDNRQVDIVIAITPKVIRAPAILPEDEIERPTGSLATPTSGSLEAMIIQEDREELLAAARRLPTRTVVQLPDTPAYVRTNAAPPAAAATTEQVKPDSVAASPVTTNADGPMLRPIDSSVKTLQINQTSDVVTPSAQPSATAETLIQQVPQLKKGQKFKLPVTVNSSTAFRSAVLGVRFDDKLVAVRSVSFGDVFGAALANKQAAPYMNQDGKMFVSLTMPDGTAALTTGVLAYIEIEALSDGTPAITLDKDVLNFLSPEGKNFALKF
jgi:hypothetical protein